jgi:nucleotide-binding universal stress UspA family protein
MVGSRDANAMVMAGVLFLCGAVAMTWIRPPKRQSPIIPLTYRRIMGYDRVIVGSDGSDSALRGVHRAAEIAASSEAELMVVCAYNPQASPESTPADPAAATHEEVRGEDRAGATLKETVARINTARISEVHQRAVAAEPAEALLGAADNPDTDLIVVGNRGLGAEGETLLGSVPGAVARGARCDVLIVQTVYHGAAHTPPG